MILAFIVMLSRRHCKKKRFRKGTRTIMSTMILMVIKSQ